MSDEAVASSPRVPLRKVALEWGRIGVTGFGGPPAHLALFRRLCVEDHDWISATEYEDAIASANLLPGPASTQMAIFCGWRVRGFWGGLVGGMCFIVPGLAVILALSALFLGEHPPSIVAGAAAGAGAAVPAVALDAALKLLPSSWARVGPRTSQRARSIVYVALGAAAAALIGPYLVVVLLGCGLVEALVRSSEDSTKGRTAPAVAAGATLLVGSGLAALAWTAFKVGALSYGGGFVIVPLMRADAVTVHHWMTSGQFLTAVALGQITPGPLLQTVAVVGYAAAGVRGAVLASVVAFAPSFVFVLALASRFDAVRRNRQAQAFLTGAGPATIGAIAGSAIPLGLSLTQPWQFVVLTGAALWLFGLRRSPLSALLLALLIGALLAVLGFPL